MHSLFIWYFTSYGLYGYILQPTSLIPLLLFFPKCINTCLVIKIREPPFLFSLVVLYLHETFGPPHSWLASWNPVMINAAKARHAERDKETNRKFKLNFKSLNFKVVNYHSNVITYEQTNQLLVITNRKMQDDLCVTFAIQNWWHARQEIVKTGSCLSKNWLARLPSAPQGKWVFECHVQTAEISRMRTRQKCQDETVFVSHLRVRLL